jgi:hypothetical protein
MAGARAGNLPIVLHADEEPGAFTSGASRPVRQAHHRFDDFFIGEALAGFTFELHVEILSRCDQLPQSHHIHAGSLRLGSDFTILGRFPFVINQPVRG